MSTSLARLIAVTAPLLLSTLAVAQTPPAPAQAPVAGQATPEPSATHLAAARELVATTRVLNPLDELIPSFGEQMKKQNVTRPELTKDLDEVLRSLGPELQLQRQRISTQVARLYAKWLTEAELKDVTAFFKTPAGIKFNLVQPDMVEEVVSAVAAWSNEVSEYTVVRVRAEMGKRGHQLQ